MRKTLARRWFAALLTLALVFSLAPASFAADPPTIELDKRSATIAVGQEVTLTATTGGTATPDTVSWSSSDASATGANKIVSTKSTGDKSLTVKGENAGQVTITAKYGDATATCVVTVTPAIVTGLEVQLVEEKGSDTEITRDTPATTTDNEGRTINRYTKSTNVGNSEWLYLKIIPTWSDGEARDSSSLSSRGLQCSAESSNTEIVSVTNGNNTAFMIRANGKDKADITVTARYTNPSQTSAVGTQVMNRAVCKVTVGGRTDVVIQEYGVSTRRVNMTEKTTKTLDAYVAINDVKQNEEINGKIKWTSSDPSVVEVRGSDTGSSVVVYANKEDKTGNVFITATYTYFDEEEKKDISVERIVYCIVNKDGSGGSTPEDPDTPTTDDVLPPGVTAQIAIKSPKSPHIMDPGSESIELTVTFLKGNESFSGDIEWSQSGNAVAIYKPDKNSRCELPISWSSTKEKVAEVTAGSRRYTIKAGEPGEAVLTAKLNDKDGPIEGATASLTVTVKGFSLLGKEFTVTENGSLDLKKDNIIGAYGGADYGDLTCWSDNSTIAAYVDGKIRAYKPGKTNFTVSDPKRGFRAAFEVEVKEDPNATIKYGTLYTQTQKVLSFSDLLSSFRRQAGGSLSHITGLNVDAGKGTLYYKYRESTGTGTGVGAGSYYHPYRKGGIPTGQPSLEDITFVPKPGFAGEVTIYYTGVSEGDENGVTSNYACKLVLTVDTGSGSNAGISLTTPYNTALKLNGDDFSRVCRERLGVKLSSVTFSQPPERQGKLYTNYVGAGNYGSPVDSQRKYSLKELEDIWFVPAPGYSGPVTIYYTAYGVGANGGSYAGQATVTVGREDGVSISGLAYDIGKGGVAYFDDEDFNDYCREILYEQNRYDRQTLSLIRFDSLPSESQGVLYYDYRSSVNTGSRAAAGTSYYYGTRTPRIDRLAFVPAEDFTGTLKIPFTGWTADGDSFGGSVEINVRGGMAVQVGDILYICPPGRTVSFDDTHFNRLSREVTGSSLNYISFRSLPGSASGTLYYNSSRANTTTNYRNGSSTPRIDNLSFKASSSFSGMVDIPFDARATNGETFRGVVTISSSRVDNSGNWNPGGASSTTFTDMAGYSDVQKAAVDFIYSRGITHGLTATQYGPQNSIRRGDFALMIYQAFGLTSGTGSQAFVDVPAGAYYSQAVNVLYSRGVVSGIGGGYYAPNSTLTRQDAVCMVQRAMRATGQSAGDGSVSALYNYSDGGSVAGYAQGAMAMAVQRGYLPTYGSWLNPYQPLTRVDMAEILYRVLTY